MKPVAFEVPKSISAPKASATSSSRALQKHRQKRKDARWRIHWGPSPNTNLFEVSDQIPSGEQRPSTLEREPYQRACHHDVATTSRIWGKPPPATAFFAGRDSELETLKSALSFRQFCAIVADPGMGKTQLMLRFAENILQNAQNDIQIFWLSGSTLASDMARLCGTLGRTGVDAANLEAATKAAVATLNREYADGKTFLLALDGIDSSDTLKVLGNHFSKLRFGFSEQSDAPASVMVTSRYTDIGLWEASGLVVNSPQQFLNSSVLKLAPLQAAYAMEVLYRQVHNLVSSSVTPSVVQSGIRTELEEEEAKALKIVAASAEHFSLGGIPLALQQAGAYISRTGNFSQYLRLLSRTSQASQPLPLDDTSKLRMAWELNIQSLCPAARRALKIIAIYSEDHIPDHLLQCVIAVDSTFKGGAFALDQAMDHPVVKQLVDASVLLQVAERGDSDAFYLQRCARDFVEDMPFDDSADSLDPLRLSLTALANDAERFGGLRQTWYWRTSANNKLALQLLPHVSSALKKHDGNARFLEVASDLAFFAAGLCMHSSAYAAAKSFANQSLQLASKTDMRRIGQSQLALATVSLFQADYTDSQNWADACIVTEKKRRGLGANTACVAVAQYVLGRILEIEGDYDEALRHYLKSAQIKTARAGGSVDPDVAIAWHGMGWTRLLQGDYSEAIKYLSHALDMRRRLHKEDPHHTEIAASFEAIGWVHTFSGDLQKALDMQLKSLQIKRHVYGENATNQALASSLHALASVYTCMQQFEKGERLQMESLKMKELIYGADKAHPQTANSVQAVGCTIFRRSATLDSEEERDKGFWKAFSFFERSRAMRVELYGPDHSCVSESTHAMGCVYLRTRNYARALECHSATLAMRIRLFVKKHGKSTSGDFSEHDSSIALDPSVGDAADKAGIGASCHAVAVAYELTGNNSAALVYYKKSLDVKLQVYGTETDHLDVAETLHEVARSHYRLGDFTAALEYFVPSLGMLNNLSRGSESDLAGIAIVHTEMGNVHHQMKAYERAAFHYSRAIAILNGRKPTINLAVALHQLGTVRFHMNDYQTALKCYDRSQATIGKIECCSNVLGVSLVAIGCVHHRCGNVETASSMFLKCTNLPIHNENCGFCKGQTLSPVVVAKDMLEKLPTTNPSSMSLPGLWVELAQHNLRPERFRREVLEGSN